MHFFRASIFSMAMLALSASASPSRTHCPAGPCLVPFRPPRDCGGACFCRPGFVSMHPIFFLLVLRIPNCSWLFRSFHSLGEAASLAQITGQQQKKKRKLRGLEGRYPLGADITCLNNWIKIKIKKTPDALPISSVLFQTSLVFICLQSTIVAVLLTGCKLVIYILTTCSFR